MLTSYPETWGLDLSRNGADDQDKVTRLQSSVVEAETFVKTASNPAPHPQGLGYSFPFL